jgi:tyrosyl-tRNA synthetase
MTTQLETSTARVLALLAAREPPLEPLLEEMQARRRMDLSDLSPAAQAELLAERARDLLPSRAALAEALGRRLTVKLGIDPTDAALHLGHAVPIALLSRLQRMGHRTVLIVGDVTARIGDPSGRSAERPPLDEAQVQQNLATYRAQVAPFFDFSRAELRHNSEWLAGVRLPELLEVLARVPVSALLQREDFRARLAAGQGLALSELIYPVVMAMDSAALAADVELGGLDQLLNMQMGRRVMEGAGLAPQLIVTVPLLEGIDGTGAKMSKSLGNTVPLAAGAAEMFGKLMSIPDRLTIPYLRAWSEWTEPELALAAARVEAGALHPMELKKLVAAEAVATVHGVGAALAARREFEARFSERRFAGLELPVVVVGEETVLAVVRRLGFAASASAARRLARQRAIRIVREGDEQGAVIVDEAMLLGALSAAVAGAEGPAYLAVGRKLARLERRDAA